MSIGRIPTELVFIEEFEDGTKCIYKGLLHHDSKPALQNEKGDKWWYLEGKLGRRDDQPAYIHHDGRQAWYQDGISHRDNDLPAHIHPNGYQEWRVHGRLHRENGPAIIDPIHGNSYYIHGTKQVIASDSDTEG